MKESGKGPERIFASDFIKRHLYSVLNIYRGSAFLALRDAGYEIDEMNRTHRPRNYWKIKKNRVTAIRLVVQRTGKDPHDMTLDDFNSNNLGGIFRGYYGGSPYLALLDAGYDVKPYEMATVPHGYWKSMENRIGAVNVLIKSTGKDPRDITRKDFIEYGFMSLLGAYNHSIGAALAEAGYNLSYKDRGIVPPNFWISRDKRINAIRDIVVKTGKEPEDISVADFQKGGIMGMIENHYRGTVFLALKDAGFDIDPMNMRKVPQGHWKLMSNRIKAVRAMVKKLGKAPNDITVDDFTDNGLSGLLQHCDRATYRALIEARYDVTPEGMRKAHGRQWRSRDNRIAAIKRLVAKLGKNVTDMECVDFRENHMGSLLSKYYKNKTYLALIDAGYQVMPWDMHCGVPNGFWKKKVNRVYALAYIKRKTGKTTRELYRADFKKYHLLGLLKRYTYREFADTEELLRIYDRHKKCKQRIDADSRNENWIAFIPTEAAYIKILQKE